MEDKLKELPVSPCVSICKLDVDGNCEGCKRTRIEIAAWRGMTQTQRLKVMAELEKR